MPGPNDFGEKIRRGVVAAAKRALQARFSAIRHPETGEFPTVVVEGNELEDLRIRIEGSPALLAIVRQRMSPEDLEGVEMTDNAPRVFLSHGRDDHDLAQRLAVALQSNGIETWLDKWEIGPGDSIRQKIDAGLDRCTHFIVLLTPNSIDRPWVKEEMDAGFVRMVDAQSKFIALRKNLGIDRLPPLLRGKLSPEIDDALSNIAELVNFIHGVSAKPRLGPKPDALNVPQTGYSAAASKIAEFFARKSTNGHHLDPQSTMEELAAGSGLTVNDVKDAVHEMRHLFHVSWDRVWPENSFFVEFDKYFMAWDPAEDALRLAADIVNDEAFPADPREIAARYEWPARRLNPAITYLGDRNLANIHGTMGTSFITYRILGNDNTRRFVKSRT